MKINSPQIDFLEILQNQPPAVQQLFDVHSFINPEKDAKLIEHFQKVEIPEIKALLKSGANGNQKIRLNELLISKIIQSMKAEIVAKLIQINIYQVLFHPKFSKEETQLLLQIIKNPSLLETMDDECIENLVMSYLSEFFEKELRGSSEVSLLWVATFLQDVQLVRELLTAIKPAELFSPLFSSDAAYYHSSICLNILFFSQSPKTIAILKEFVAAGFDPQWALSPFCSNTLMMQAVDQRNFDLLHFFSDQKFNLNFTLKIDDFNFNERHKGFVDYDKIFPDGEFSPLSLAVFNKDAEMVVFLKRLGAQIYTLSDFEMDQARSLLFSSTAPLNFPGIKI